jgi:hypothetical protein
MNSYTSGAKQGVDLEHLQLKRLVRELQTRVDGMDILNYYDAQNVSEQPNNWGTQLVHSCLIDKVEPHHTNGDASPSASLLNERLYYNCWSYGGGDILWFLQKMEGTGRAGVIPVLSKLLQGGTKSPTDFLAEISKYFVQTTRVATIPTYNVNVLSSWLQIHPYLVKARGLDVDVLQEMYVGYDEEEIRLVFPHFWQGKLVGWQKRRLDDPRWPMTPVDSTGKNPKYKNSFSFPKDETLYNWHNAQKSKEVLVLEGPVTVLKSMSLAKKLPEQSNLLRSAVSTFGAKVTETQIRVLRSVPKVVVWFDSDPAGWAGSIKLIKGLMNYTNVWVVPNLGVEGDLVDLTDSEALGLLQSAVPSSLQLPLLEETLREYTRQTKQKTQSIRMR